MSDNYLLIARARNQFTSFEHISHSVSIELLDAFDAMLKRELRILVELDDIDGDAVANDSEYGNGMSAAATRIRAIIESDGHDGNG